MVLGDAGAGGANVDYQVAGIANYQIKPKWGIGIGYRYLDVDYRNSNRFIFDTHQSGMVLTLLYNTVNNHQFIRFRAGQSVSRPQREVYLQSGPVGAVTDKGS